MSEKQSKRLLSLDVLRGITIAGMLLVNNPGSWGHIFAPLSHAEWNGLTPTDLVFPFFMFIMGVSMYFSMRKFEFKLSGYVCWKIIRRTVIIFAIGLAIAWFGHFCRTLAHSDLPFWDRLLEAANNLEQMRILGVMPRLALCYCAGAFIMCLVNIKRVPWIAAGLLVIYSAMLIFGHGYEISENNVLYIIDNVVLGANHMYHLHPFAELGLAFDPEGLASTIPAVAHVLIGAMCGYLIIKIKDNHERVKNLLITGFILMAIGWLLSYGLPINKNIWSTTFVLVTTGMASSFLAFLIWVIDIEGKKEWSKFFETFGINPLFLYVLGGVLSILFSSISLPIGGEMVNIHNIIYKEFLLNIMPNAVLWASFFYALIFVCINWCVGLILYKKKIYIKI